MYVKTVLSFISLFYEGNQWAQTKLIYSENM